MTEVEGDLGVGEDIAPFLGLPYSHLICIL